MRGSNVIRTVPGSPGSTRAFPKRRVSNGWPKSEISNRPVLTLWSPGRSPRRAALPRACPPARPRPAPRPTGVVGRKVAARPSDDPWEGRAAWSVYDPARPGRLYGMTCRARGARYAGDRFSTHRVQPRCGTGFDGREGDPSERARNGVGESGLRRLGRRRCGCSHGCADCLSPVIGPRARSRVEVALVATSRPERNRPAARRLLCRPGCPLAGPSASRPARCNMVGSAPSGPAMPAWPRDPHRRLRGRRGGPTQGRRLPEAAPRRGPSRRRASHRSVNHESRVQMPVRRFQPRPFGSAPRPSIAAHDARWSPGAVGWANLDPGCRGMRSRGERALITHGVPGAAAVRLEHGDRDRRTACPAREPSRGPDVAAALALVEAPGAPSGHRIPARGSAEALRLLAVAAGPGGAVRGLPVLAQRRLSRATTRNPDPVTITSVSARCERHDLAAHRLIAPGNGPPPCRAPAGEGDCKGRKTWIAISSARSESSGRSLSTDVEAA